MKSIFVTAALAASSLFAFSANAQAADARLCYSSLFTQSSGGTSTGTVNYPQLTNATKYTCNSSTQYTLYQLAQAGWIVVAIDETLYSTTFNSNGTTVTNSRYRLIIRR